MSHSLVIEKGIHTLQKWPRPWLYHFSLRLEHCHIRKRLRVTLSLADLYGPALRGVWQPESGMGKVPRD